MNNVPFTATIATPQLRRVKHADEDSRSEQDQVTSTRGHSSKVAKANKAEVDFSRKQKETLPETGIEHISEIGTRQVEIHTGASNATPAATTRATRPRPRLATVGAVDTQKKGTHALKSRDGPKKSGVSLAKADFSMGANSDGDELEGPLFAPTSQKSTQKELPPCKTYKEVRTAIEAKKLQRVANQAQALVVVNNDHNLEIASYTATGTGGQVTEFTSDQELSNRPSTKRAHVYDFADPNTPTIQSPMAKRTRGSHFGNSKASARQVVPIIDWKSQVELSTSANTMNVEAGVDDMFDSQQVDTPADLFQADGEDSQFRVDERGGRFEEAGSAADDRHDIRAKQRVKTSDKLTWMGGRDTETNAAVESNDDKAYLSSEVSSSEYEPSELGKSESAFDEMDSDTGRSGFRKSPDAEPALIPLDRCNMRPPFVNELYDDYKEWHRRSDDEDDQSWIHIQRGYYGDSLVDGSQPLEVNEAQEFDVLNPGQNVSADLLPTQIKSYNLLGVVGIHQ
ncbi:hypothetical protein Agabi119p4_4946 [Agaricus bisporus var. burnettii]|uniref:Uncharacterized protein n=1 Tax=Agaricus bisporus var. burnettii TaxID=192524 RepID=A0A8H7KHV1_AGABI|nr:hypothetical protein Agabi119p4_4946 [Agaricus bisporus var. burnettii]